MDLLAQGVAADIADIAIGLVLDPGPARGLGEDEHLLAEQKLAVQRRIGDGLAAQVGVAGNDLHRPAFHIGRGLDPPAQALRGEVVAIGMESWV